MAFSKVQFTRLLAALRPQAKPAFISSPVITSDPLIVGSQVTYVNGAYIGNPAPTLSTEILVDGLVVGSTYTAQVGDVGKLVVVRQTVTNSYGSDVASSTGVVVEAVGSSGTVAELKLIGGQPYTLHDYTREPMTNDLMKRARSYGTYPGNGNLGSGYNYEVPTTLNVVSLTRTSNVTTVVVSSNQSLSDQPLYTGQKLHLTYFFDSSFDADGAKLTRISNTSFSYPNPGSDTGTITMDSVYDCPAHAESIVDVGANGQPIQDFQVLLSISSGSDSTLPDLVGNYTGKFSGGKPTSVVGIGATINYNFAAGTFTFNLTAGATGFFVVCFGGVPTDGSFVIPQIVRNDHPQTNPPFLRADVLQHYQRFPGGMRTMDLVHINGNAWVKSWAGRTRVNHGAGLTIEDQVRMCNELGCDLWFNIPTLADDTWIDGAAAYIRDNLDPSLNAYFEWSNEIWNAGFFTQWHWVHSMTRVELQSRMSGFDGLNQIVSVVRNGSNQITITFNGPCPYTNGQHIAVQLVGADTSCNGTNITLTDVSGNTCTYTNNGAAKTFTFSRVTTYGNLASPLLVGTNWDPTSLLERMVMKKIYDFSQRISTVFGGLNTTRAKMVFMWQLALFQGPGSNPIEQLQFAASTWGPVKNYLYAIGGAPYAVSGGGNQTPAQILANMKNSMDTDLVYRLHSLKYTALLHGVKCFNYEGGPDPQNLSAANTDTFWVSDEHRQISEYILNAVVSRGVDLHMQFYSSLRWHGYSGSTSWGFGNTMSEVLPRGGASDPRSQAFDNVLAALPAPVDDTNLLPVSLTPVSGTNVNADGYKDSFVTNGMARLYLSTSYVEYMVGVASTGNYVLNLKGKCKVGSGSNGVRVYVDDVLVGSLNLFSDGTGVDTGPSGGTPSPTNLTLSLTEGHRRIRFTCPASIPDEMGIGRVDINPERLVVQGKDLISNVTNSPVQLRGVNQGTWGQNFASDAPAIAALGSNCVRTVFRWWGNYPEVGADSRTSDVSQGYINPANLAKFLQEVKWLVDQGLWVIVAFDSDCGQDGLQDSGTAAFCDPTNLYPTTGHNFWTDTTIRGFFKVAWQFLAQKLRRFPRIAMLEVLPEPLDNRDATWADDVRDFYRDVITSIRTVDSTPCLIGARGAYEVMFCDEAWLSERTDIVYTGNILDPKVNNVTNFPNYISALVTMRDTRNVPVFIQQFGRKSSNDASLDNMRAAMFAANAWGLPYAWWQYHQNTALSTEYALYYKDGFGGWTPKTAEINAYSYAMTMNVAALESAAIAAATAAGALLFYIKSDFSNVFQDSGGTSPVTAVSQPIGRINAVVGSGNLTQTTSAARVTCSAGVNRYVWTGDGAADCLVLNSTYFASGDDTIVIVAGTTSNVNNDRLMFHCGTSGTNARYPYVGVNASDVPTASWRGDDTILREINGTTDCNARPVVLTATKVGNIKNLYVNGSTEGTTDTGAVGTVSLSTTKVASATTSTGFWPGTMSLVCLAKSMTLQQQQAIERYAAFLVGAAYKK